MGPESERLRLAGLEPEHIRLESSLHRQAHGEHLFVPALLYASARLPSCMPQVKIVSLAAQREAFARHGVGDVSGWQRVSADKRRRLYFFDGAHSLASLVCSASDVDDLVPSLCAYQIEWNKMHRRLAASPLGADLAAGRVRASSLGHELPKALGLNRADYQALAELWGRRWDRKLAAVAAAPKDLELVILPLNDQDFRAAFERWWQRVLDAFEGMDLAHRPIYLSVSNNHSLVNLVSGFAVRHAADLIAHGHEHLGASWRRAYSRLLGQSEHGHRNLLYLAQEEMLAQDRHLRVRKREMEEQVGVRRTEQIPPLLAEAQVLELGGIMPRHLDPRLRPPRQNLLAGSRAVVLNVDYPLGAGGYYLVKVALEKLPGMKGLFILGKSAAMLGRLGDMLIPTQVHDVHSARLFEVNNCLSARRLTPYLYDAAVFDEQRSLTVHGTFLHSWDTVRRMHRADFTGIEMEAGPCLAALSDHFAPRLAGRQGLASLSLPPGFSLGILHYTSDTPYNLRASLLSHPLGLFGLEPTYAGSLAIWQYILDQAGSAGE
jgi:hypothetical protein